MPLSKINPWDMLQAMMEQSEPLDPSQQRSKAAERKRAKPGRRKQRPNERDTLPET
jgi:hypothetical protein